MRRHPLVVLVACLLAACSSQGDDSPPAAPPAVPPAAPASASSAAPLGAGDLRIVTREGQFDLVLVGDSITSGLSPATLETARRNVDTAGVSGSGMGASIERMVKGAVGGAIGTRVAFPLSAVRDVRYEGGALRFDWSGDRVKLFDQTKVNGRPFLESFEPADAERFAAAVRARKQGASAPVAQ